LKAAALFATVMAEISRESVLAGAQSELIHEVHEVITHARNGKTTSSAG
jgi:hypothetical protein